MNPQVQKWLVTSLAGVTAALLSHTVAGWFVEEAPPTRRGLEDDMKKAALKAGASLAATVVASVLVRRLLRNR